MPDHQAPLTRPSLILRLRRQDDFCAWEEFVEIYQPVIHQFARRRGLQDSDAQDVTQEVMTRVARSIQTWDPDSRKGRFRGWLATITRNLVIQSFRDGVRHPATGMDAQLGEVAGASGAGDESTVEEFDRERERQLFLWAARRVQPRVQPQTWKAFWLTSVQNQEIASVASQLNTSKAQIYVARSRVMRLLKETVERTEFDQPDGEGS